MGIVHDTASPAFSRARAMKKRRILTKLYAATFFSDSAVTRVDGATGNTLGFKQFLAGLGTGGHDNDVAGQRF
ncbi:hypothetical protein NLM27_17830 [Bradyrhizobium sp. CCGB12]|uniref:hypothetical protein n=1 Tax=Bradyrhizobium sp. CCGB12 TaxID=2949632 RepID=UPI0020B2F9DA|nr:hypothetical protein [Bradyrhizobium sp. CCGB12]MCP3390641.1 hypothetical protein [Bradyrhizobium sp. CCGB12]